MTDKHFFRFRITETYERKKTAFIVIMIDDNSTSGIRFSNDASTHDFSYKIATKI